MSSATSEANSIYRYTSYYKNNSLLSYTLWTLNNNITNVTNIREIIKKNDLSKLISALNNLRKNPIDEKATKNLDYLVRKYTVIGSVLK